MKNNAFKLKLLEFFLVLFIIAFLFMGYIIYKLYTQKTSSQNIISSLENKIYHLINTNESFETYNNLNSSNTSIYNENFNNNITSSTQTNISESEAQNIAQSIYEKAYTMLYDSSSNVIMSGQYNINGELKSANKINLSSLESVFSEKVIHKIKSRLLEYNGYYYDLSTSPSFFEQLDLNSIFGSTDQGIRLLTIKSFSDNLIIAQGQLTLSNNSDITYGDSDKYPLYIIFVKEDDNWLIDLYE